MVRSSGYIKRTGIMKQGFYRYISTESDSKSKVNYKFLINRYTFFLLYITIYIYILYYIISKYPILKFILNIILRFIYMKYGYYTCEGGLAKIQDLTPSHISYAQRGELLFMNREVSSSANKGKEPLAEPLDLELRLGPPGGTANPDLSPKPKRGNPISDQALQAWENFLKKKSRNPSTEAEESNFHNETLCSGFFSTLLEDVKTLYKETASSQVSPSDSKWKKVILKLTSDKGPSYTKYVDIINDLNKRGAESESFKEILKILEELS